MSDALTDRDFEVLAGGKPAAPETVIMGGPPVPGTLQLPDATLGRCEDCTARIVYKGLAPAEIATVCVECAARRAKCNPDIVIIGPSGQSQITLHKRTAP